MPCDFDRIDALLEGSLPEDQRASVLTHIESCSACRAYHDAMASLEGTQAVPEGFTARVMEQVRRTPQKKAAHIPYRKLLSGLAACVLLVIAVSAAPLLGFSGVDGSGGSAVQTADGARNTGGSAPEDAVILPYDDAADSDSLLPVYTLTDDDLCAQARSWLAQNGKLPLYDGVAPREAYDLTAEEVMALNQAIPEAALPNQTLQLELKIAE